MSHLGSCMVMIQADSDLESILDDEIVYVSGFEEADEDDIENNKDLSVADEATTDNVTNELVDMANTQDANAKFSIAKGTNSDSLGHVQADITSHAAKVNHLKSSMY
nr:hypothetical protein [Tanacetum cinerariifolium]